MKTVMLFFSSCLVWSTNCLLVNRTSAGDIFSGTFCKIAYCQCDDEKTFYVNNDSIKKSCYESLPATKTQVGSLQNNDIREMNTNMLPVTCHINSYPNLTIWNYHEKINKSIWQSYEIADWMNTNLFVMKNGTVKLKELSSWNGLLVRFDYKCMEEKTYKSLYAKFMGVRQYPLPDSLEAILRFVVEEESSSNVGLIIGVVVGVLLCIGIIIIVLVYLKKCKKSKETISNDHSVKLNMKEEDVQLYEPLTKVYDKDTYEDTTTTKSNQYETPIDGNDDGYQDLLVHQEQQESLMYEVPQNTDPVSKRIHELNQPNSSKKLSSKLKWIPKVSFKKHSTKYHKPTNNVYQATTEDISSPAHDTVEYKNLHEERKYSNISSQSRLNSDTKPRLPTIVKTPSGAAEFRKNKREKSSSSSLDEKSPSPQHYEAPQSIPTSDSHYEVMLNDYQSPTSKTTPQNVGNTMFDKTNETKTVKERIQKLFDNTERNENSSSKNNLLIKSKSDSADYQKKKKQPPKVAPKKKFKSTSDVKSNHDDIYENVVQQDYYTNVKDI